MAAEEPRARRPAKKPAWMNEEMVLDPAEVDAEVRAPRPLAPARPRAGADVRQHLVAAHQESMLQRYRPDLPRRMCTFSNCKSPFDSPQWRRGPLGPGTLCNACGTRFARLQNKVNSEKKGKLRPAERVEWDAFMDMLNGPAGGAAQQHQAAWQARMQQQHQAAQPYYDQADALGIGMAMGGGYSESDAAAYAAAAAAAGVYDERSFSSGQAPEQQHRLQQQQQQQQLHEGEDGDEEFQQQLPMRPRAQQQQQRRQQYASMYEDEYGAAGMEHEPAAAVGLTGSPGMHARHAAAAAGAGGAQRPGSRAASGWRSSRAHFSSAAAAAAAAEAATDSQEDEAAAYLHKQDGAASDAAAAAAAAAGGTAAAADDSFLHLLAVGEAMIKTEGVAPQDRRAAWAEVVERQLAPEPGERPAARQGEGGSQGVKRSRFALEAEEQQRPAGAPEPTSSAQTALQRALERVTGGSQQAASGQHRHKPAAAAAAASAAGPGAAAAPSAADRFERLLAEAEQCIRARSVSPCMLRGAAGGLSPSITMPAPRPLTPLQLGVSALDAASGRSPLPRSLLGQEVGAAQQRLQQQLQAGEQAGVPSLFLPSAAVDMSRSSGGGGIGQTGMLQRLAGGGGQQQRTASGGEPAASLGSAPLGRSRLEQMQVLISQLQQGSSEPSPHSQGAAGEEVLSPTTSLASGRPLKQARTGAQQDAGGRSLLDEAVAAGQSLGPVHASAHTTQQSLLQALLQGTGGAAALGSEGGAQAPVLLACQLLLQQQQAGAAALGPLLDAGLAAAGVDGSGMTTIDQLKAASETAAAAAAHASAVAAATSLLWQQLQRQQQEQEQMQQLAHPAPQQQQQQPAQQPHSGDALQASGSPRGQQPDADMAGAQPDGPDDDGSREHPRLGHASRSNSSSTSAAGLSAAAAAAATAAAEAAAAGTADSSPKETGAEPRDTAAGPSAEQQQQHAGSGGAPGCGPGVPPPPPPPPPPAAASIDAEHAEAAVPTPPQHDTPAGPAVE